MFSSPLVLLALVIGLMVAVYLLLGARDKQTQASRGKGGKGGSRGKKPPARRNQPRWLRLLPVVFLIGAVACLVVALAQFRLSTRESGATVMLVMDASASMNQTDVAPSRLAAAEAAAHTFLGQLPDTLRVGLVTFADTPSVLVQPTTDHSRVDSALVSPPRGKGTVIGDGLTAALDTIAAQQEAGGSAAIVLLSDGRDTGSQVAPDAAAARAAAAGIKVYTVALGEATGTGGANVGLLQQIASITGAQTSTAATAGELNQAYGSLGTQISTELKISSSAQLFVIIAVLLGLGAGLAVLLTSRPQF